jgi:REP element-mobilizing transposase RayT
VVFCPKYRKPVLNPPIDAKLKKLIQQVCGETQSALIEMEVMPDHVHLLVGCDPQYGIHRLVKGIKGRSSRVLRQQFRGCARAFQHLSAALPSRSSSNTLKIRRGSDGKASNDFNCRS